MNGGFQNGWHPDKVEGDVLRGLLTAGYWQQEKRNVALLLSFDGSQMFRSHERSISTYCG